MRHLMLTLVCCACTGQPPSPEAPDPHAALRAATLERTANYSGLWDGAFERVELLRFEDDTDLFVAIFDSQAEWWGDFVVFCSHGSALRWVATLATEDEPQYHYAISARGFRLAGFPDPLVETFWSTHMGNGALHLFELRDRRLRLLLKATAVDDHGADGSVFRGGKLETQYQDVNGDGIQDVVLVGMCDDVVFESGRVVASRAVRREYYWNPKSRVFEAAPG